MSIDHVWALSGGGANGAYENGVIQRLAEAVEAGDIPEPDAIVGTSVGSLNASKLCQFPKGQFKAGAEALDAEWDRLKSNRDIYKPHFWGLVPSMFLFGLKLKRSIYNTEALQEHVRENLDPDLIAASGRHFACNAVEIGGKSESRWFETGDPHIVKGVLASSAYPIFFEPVQIEGAWYTDGGIRDTTPIGKAIDLGAKSVLVISCSPDGLGEAKKDLKGLDALQRSIRICLDEIDLSDFQTAALINELVKAGSSVAEINGWRVVDLQGIRPGRGLGDSLDFDRAKNAELRRIGYEDAERFLRSD
jgi:NTE family protein